MATFGKKRVVSFTSDGEHVVVDGTQCGHGTLTSEGTGAVTIGYKSSTGIYTEYADSVLTGEGKVVDHGVGETLMIKVSGISGTMTISYTPGC